MENKTPIQETIKQVRGLTDRDYSKEEIVTILQSLLPKEREFVGRVYEAGWNHGYECGFDMDGEHEHLDRNKFINQLYPQK